MIYGKIFNLTSIEELAQIIRHVLGNVPCDFLPKTVNDIPNPINKLIEAKGAHIEF